MTGRENPCCSACVSSLIAMWRWNGQDMSQLGTGIFVAIAVSVSLGAAQLASGRDLSGLQDPPATPAAAGTLEASINRAAKADRAARITEPAAVTRTVSLQLQSLSNTSILIRVPVAQEARSRAPSVRRSNGKMAVACEPMVSVLTEVARQLQPGRCVT
jgi:hypothetical protein